MKKRIVERFLTPGTEHLAERERSWSTMKAQLRTILEDFLAIEASGDAASVTGTKSAEDSSCLPVGGEVEEIHLPPHLFCVCLGEPELGLYAADIPCNRCEQVGQS
jgi:hypothetical protein